MVRSSVNFAACWRESRARRVSLKLCLATWQETHCRNAEQVAKLLSSRWASFARVHGQTTYVSPRSDYRPQASTISGLAPLPTSIRSARSRWTWSAKLQGVLYPLA